ncbi:MAG: hypothetical protein K8S27_08910 [Candidatus Omnitrophica bacterium]|nr:hypothetical protein [Candidatus Omnitrophota bacterium]
MTFDLKRWTSTASKLTPKPHMKIQNAYFERLRFINKMQWQGACHASSSILYILFKEQKFNAKLYIGEVGALPLVFDHSWVEIDNRIYDVAIASTLISGTAFPPVFAGIDLQPGQKTKNEYGINSGQGYDPVVKQIKQTPFEEYMSSFPAHPKGLWGLAMDIGKNIGLIIDLDQIKSKYLYTIWNEKA